MKTSILVSAGVIALSLVSTPVVMAAPIHDPVVNAQQHRQHARINQGVRSGQLTRSETQTLASQHRTLRQQERSYKSDGVMSSDERQDMRQDNRSASQSIYNEKHDAEVQPRIAQ
ncbi:MAG: hypothetical protein AB1717_03965 [Pseudomonadota bacterium]